MNNELEIKGKKAKAVSYVLGNLSQQDKNQGLLAAASALIDHQKDILNANKKDLDSAKANGIKGALIDRLKLTEKRISGMSDGLKQIAQLEDPIGEMIHMKNRPNGLRVGLRRVPIGVIGIIYEARPNVTADAFGLCFKAGNAVILRGGKEAIHSNKIIVETIQKALQQAGLPEESVQLVEDTSRETATELMKLNQYLDLLIPRGGAGLIQAVIKHSTVPVIETGVGNCHTYVDEYADLDMALKIVINAKTQRPGVCNACESLVIHQAVLNDFLPQVVDALKSYNVQMVGDEAVRKLIPEIEAATNEDWGTEYLDYKISIKTVKDIHEAIEHINTYNTKHSEAIITENYTHAQLFLDLVDAAAVYVNASTRFTDGEVFGFGAEIGISTQKLHARGPMGLKELTSTKYIIYGSGQIR